MTTLSDLPPVERIQRYLDLACSARREAKRTKGLVRRSYMLIANQWEQLGDLRH